ncbi:PIN domain-containing protein, partial [Agrobacterium tumefaciens]
DWEPVATHIQWDEIQQTKDASIRLKISAIFSEYLKEKTPTTSAVWGLSKWGESEWTGPTSMYKTLVDQLDKERAHRNNPKDALIADTCLQRGLALVTNDRPLLRVAELNNIPTFNLEGSR